MKAKPTGHGLPLPNQDGEAPVNLVFDGGNTSVDEMVASTDRGILLTRLWYIREVDPYEKVLTGMTRDGSFLVENGAHRRRHPQFPLQPKHPRNALERRADRPRRPRRRRRIVRDGRPRHEGPQLPLHRSHQVLAFTFSSPSHSFFTVVIPRSVATRNLSFCEASLRTKRSYHTHCHHETLRPMPDRLYYVYILASASRVLYTGVTNNLRRRVSQHKKPDPENPASTFTHKYQVTQLMHIEVFRDVRTAIAREKQIKAWTRAKRVALIDANNPRWKDLSEEWSQPSRPAKPAQPAQTKTQRNQIKAAVHCHKVSPNSPRWLSPATPSAIDTHHLFEVRPSVVRETSWHFPKGAGFQSLCANATDRAFVALPFRAASLESSRCRPACALRNPDSSCHTGSSALT